MQRKFIDFNLIPQLIILSLSVLFLTNGSKAQKSLFGNITNESFEAIEFATIQFDSRFNAVSDRNGYFNIKFPSEINKGRLIIRALGYETIDTLINLNTKDTYFNFKLETKAFYLKEVEINPEITVFDKKNWTIHDYVIQDNKIIILYSWFKKRKLGVYNLNGETLQSYDVENSFKQLKKSHLNTILLLGNKEFIEVVFTDGVLKEIGKNSMSFYHELLETCIAEIGDELLYKNYSIHNKRLEYYLLSDQKNVKILYEVFDEAGAIVSQSYYNEIIGTYHAQVLAEENLIELGVWNGDLMKLAVNWSLFKLISQFLHLELKEVNANEFVSHDSLYVLDYIKEEIIQIDLLNPRLEINNLEGFDWRSDEDVIVKDQITDDIFFVNEKNALLEFKKSKKGPEFVYKKQMKLNGSFHEKFVLSNNILYYISYDYKNRPSINKLSINN